SRRAGNFRNSIQLRGCMHRLSQLNSSVFTRTIVQAVLGSVAVLLFCAPAQAQVNLGRIDGTITDQSGAAIVGATVTVTDVARGVSRNLTTDTAGAYSAPNLTPGSYTVHTEYAGFKAVNRQDIVVEVGQDIRVDISMQPGEQTQTVTVTGE